MEEDAVPGKVKIAPAKFAQIDPSVAKAKPKTNADNSSLLMDVPLTVVVELGRARKLFREVLSFTPGTVIELEKLTGEPLDILVNGKPIARGEVVVMDENFAVRVTEIIGAHDGKESGEKA
ncbi:MAG TPA: flagellar motor switch protein FliN [Firmicutes bacterium]|nr:flagellar motor switch protein FliN [Bacillota bacterium]